MNLETIVQTLQLSVKSGRDRLGVEVRGGYVGDLLSDVMANSREGDLWITRQIHQNIVAVASLKDLAGIILVRGAEPAEDTLEKAVRENIPLLTADLPAFEIAGRIYQMICPRGHSHCSEEPVEKGSLSGCSKMARCKAPEILSREAYFRVR